MIADVLLGLMAASGGVAAAIIGNIFLRKYRAAQTTDTNASARERRANAQKTEGEAWRSAMDDNTDLFAKVSQLQGQVFEVTELLGQALTWITEAQRRNAQDPTLPLPALPATLKMPAA